jgi:hypothetical protein
MPDRRHASGYRFALQLVVGLGLFCRLVIPAHADLDDLTFFVHQLVTDEDELAARPHLLHREAYLKAAASLRAGDREAGLKTFRDYYFAKLANAHVWLGLPLDTLDATKPYNNAHGAALNNDPAQQTKIIAQAEQLLTQDPEDLPWTGSHAMPLLSAYVYTRDARYAARWCDLMDAWSEAESYPGEIRPLRIAPGETKGLSFAFQAMRLLQAAASVSPDTARDFRPDTLARVLGRFMRSFAFLTEFYHRSNPRNWINENAYMLCWLGPLWDESKAGERLFARGRGMFELYGSTHVLPDGSEIQRFIGYNFMYLVDGEQTTRLLREMYPDPDRRPAWKSNYIARQWDAEQGALLRDRARFLVRMIPPGRGMPIGMRPDFRDFQTAPLRLHAGPVMDEPDTAAVLQALHRRPSPQEPEPASDAMPWGGYFWQRASWAPDADYAILFNASFMGDLGFLGRSANNAFGLRAYGMDMLDVGVDGPYSIRPSPLLVDGQPQNKNAGIFLTDIEPHMPITNRWFTSPTLDLAETDYTGPYAPNVRHEDAASIAGQYRTAVLDATHRRQLIHVKEARVWVCVDRVTSPRERAIELIWRLPGPPASRDRIKTFSPDLIRLDADQQAFHTGSPNQPNLSLYHVGTHPLTMAIRPPARARPTRLTVLTDLPVQWRAAGASAVATLIHPRPNQETHLRKYEPVESDHVIGFNAELPNDRQIFLRTSRDGAPRDLTIGNIRMTCELLLLHGTATNWTGFALNGTDLLIDDRSIGMEHPDVYVEYRQGHVRFEPILPPVMPVLVHPARQGFMESETVTLSCETPDARIRYTLDGREPTPRSPLYTGPIRITETTVLRARAYRNGVVDNPSELNGRRASPPVWAFFERLEALESMEDADLEPGLWAERFDGFWVDMAHALDLLNPVERRPVTRLFEKWSGVPAPEQHRPGEPEPPFYGLRYTGYIRVPTTGLYTFHAPDHFIRDNFAAGYELKLNVAGRDWIPSRARHGLGTWTIALKQGLHTIRVEWVDYRGSSVSDFYHPDLRVNWIWHGREPPLHVTGGGLQKEAPPADWFWRNRGAP